MNKKDFGTPPVEVSENLRSLEIDKRTLRKTHRVHQFNTSVSEEWLAKLRTVAYGDRLKYVEVLEKALECYEKHRNKENQPQPSKQKPVPKPTQKLNQFWKVNFSCDKCHQKFEKSRVYSPAPNLDQLNQYPTYCADCGESKPEFCSFWTETNPEPCSHFIFDKKKQLCRSHNKQVWKKFHEFTKEMSVSGTASWYEAWNQSGDWRYFWNLAEGKKGNNEN